MRRLIDHILHVASENNKKITHLQLQKVAYFAFGYLIHSSHNELARDLYSQERFQAWTYGPVLPKVYEDYSKYNSTPILSEGNRSEDLERVQNLNRVILNLINRDVFDLVAISHKHAFWKKNKDKILKNERPSYTFEDIRREFKK